MKQDRQTLLNYYKMARTVLNQYGYNVDTRQTVLDKHEFSNKLLKIDKDLTPKEKTDIVVYFSTKVVHIHTMKGSK